MTEILTLYPYEFMVAGISAIILFIILRMNFSKKRLVTHEVAKVCNSCGEKVDATICAAGVDLNKECPTCNKKTWATSMKVNWK